MRWWCLIHRMGRWGAYVRDPSFGWIDTFSVVGRELCLIEHQLWRAPGEQSGVDRMVKSFVLWRVPLLGEGRWAEDSAAVEEQDNRQ